MENKLMVTNLMDIG